MRRLREPVVCKYIYPFVRLPEHVGGRDCAATLIHLVPPVLIKCDTVIARHCRAAISEKVECISVPISFVDCSLRNSIMV